MIQTIKSKVATVGLLLLPMVASAQILAGADFFTKFKNFINASIGVLLALATLIFLVGVVQFVIAGGDEKKVTTAKTFMLWGIIGLVLMVAVWGIVNLLVTTLNLQNTTAATLPFSF